MTGDLLLHGRIWILHILALTPSRQDLTFAKLAIYKHMLDSYWTELEAELRDGGNDDPTTYHHMVVDYASRFTRDLVSCALRILTAILFDDLDFGETALPSEYVGSVLNEVGMLFQIVSEKSARRKRMRCYTTTLILLVITSAHETTTYDARALPPFHLTSPGGIDVRAFAIPKLPLT